VSRPYLNHGRRHKPGGDDPIPGLGETIKWAYLSANGTSTTCPATSNTQLTADQASFYTNDSSTYDVAQNGAGIYGIRLLADGHYLFWLSARPDSIPTAGDLFSLTVVGGGVFPDFTFAPIGVVFPTGGLTDEGILVNGGVMCVGGFLSAPTNPITGRIDNHSADSLSYQLAGIVVIQLDTDNTDLD
jgi:hypothetical protein